MGATGCSWSETKSSAMAAELVPASKGDHNALHDAKFQAELFRLARDWKRWFGMSLYLKIAVGVNLHAGPRLWTAWIKAIEGLRRLLLTSDIHLPRQHEAPHSRPSARSAVPLPTLSAALSARV